MTTALWLRDIGAFSLQVALVVSAGAALARAFRMRAPQPMLRYWQALLVACLLLPLCQPWRSVVSPALDLPILSVATEPSAGVQAAIARTAWIPQPRTMDELVLLVLAAGVAARAVWLAIGACALRRLRRDASRLDPLPAGIRDAQTRLGIAACICVSDRTAGPITFGLLHPVVVFPPSVQSMPSHVQEAIAYHELLHVQRRDWLYEIVEEIVRSVFWFHPALWWLIGRIQLSREQVVDQAAIRLTDSRESYVDALLTVALDQSPLSLIPAPPFLRRNLLKKRVAQILEETPMSTRRLIASLTASAAALALAATMAVRIFPLRLEAQGRAPAAAGQTSAAAAPVQIVRGGEHLLHASIPEYPHRAIEQKIEGDVIVDLTIDERGEVSDARVRSGPDELRRAALESALQWHYSPAALRSTSTEAVLRFRLPAGERSEAMTFVPAGATERSLDGTQRLTQIGTERVSRTAANEVLARAGVKVGDPITKGVARRLREIASRVDEHFHVSFDSDGKGGIVVGIVAR